MDPRSLSDGLLDGVIADSPGAAVVRLRPRVRGRESDSVRDVGVAQKNTLSHRARASQGVGGGARDRPVTQEPLRVVIVGAGFAGLDAKALRNEPVYITIVDRRNFHLFQPLLYQAAVPL